MDDEARQAIIDAEHLKLLRWGYFISAGLSACFSVLGLFYARMGAFIANVPVKEGQDAPPQILRPNRHTPSPLLPLSRPSIRMTSK
ncbi:MAG: hypothetical protein JRJ80_13755 [Deltaproteobacteria bacterium]|nr:hypothetical protein [Deltaproteobacteria bacterium]